MEYIVIDTESCTGKSNDGSLCSVGLLVCDDKLNVISREDILCNPIPKKFTVGDKKHEKQTHVVFSYTEEEFRKAPKFCDIYDKIKMFFTGRTVLGFAMSNDIKYLNDACDKYSLPRLEYDFYDIQYIYQLLHPEATKVGLKTLADNYGITFCEHRSDEDAYVSSLVLKNAVDEKGSLNSVISEYSIHPGRNSANGYYNCYSDAVTLEKFGLKRSKRIQNAILYTYISGMPRQKGKKVCFSQNVEKLDVDYVRTIVDLMYEKGYVYTNNADDCSVFITHGKADYREESLDRRKRRKATKFSLSEFENIVGYEENFTYDDVKLLETYYHSLK